MEKTGRPAGVEKRPNRRRPPIRWLLLAIDSTAYLLVWMALLVVYPSSIDQPAPWGVAMLTAIGYVCVMGVRFFLDVYRQIWRFVSLQAYIRLIMADLIGGFVFLMLRYIPAVPKITFARGLAMISINLLIVLTMRIAYQYLYQSSYTTRFMRALGKFLNRYLGFDLRLGDGKRRARRIRVAIVGAGSVGVMLAEELLHNPWAAYEPVCFIDKDESKIGRMVFGIRVLSEQEVDDRRLGELQVQEIVLALPQLDAERKRELYDRYKRMGYKVKVYDYPMTQSESGGKRQMREFQIEDLLFRPAINLTDARMPAYYKGKTVLITGGGGSIGSELCRQIAKMEPRQLVILDICENGAYDVQQELNIAYGGKVPVAIEIASICDEAELDEIFESYKPDIVLHAAAHKHVPLMEHNVCEAVKNNVFGTWNVLEAARRHGVKRFIMISTDKAVNPTNVMGATKRMCEMLVLSEKTPGDSCVYSCTRFGNVLGSAGSVVPLFRRQIGNGGPVTLTDKRIIRYFMTIPEASQLVLQSGEMARNGELFVLDMGKPVRILELAENMIRLMGYEPYKDIQIVETGLRPGEKLYEELLIESEALSKTQNELIFIEKDARLSQREIGEKMAILREAVLSRDDGRVKEALKKAVDTFHSPEEVNRNAIEAAGM